jgi:hypothetical protein
MLDHLHANLAITNLADLSLAKKKYDYHKQQTVF